MEISKFQINLKYYCYLDIKFQYFDKLLEANLLLRYFFKQEIFYDRQKNLDKVALLLITRYLSELFNQEDFTVIVFEIRKLYCEF